MKTGHGSICQFEELTNNEKDEKDINNEANFYNNQSVKDLKSTTTRPSTCTQCNRTIAGTLDREKNINARSAAYFTNKQGGIQKMTVNGCNNQHQVTQAHSRGTLNEITEKPPGKRVQSQRRFVGRKQSGSQDQFEQPNNNNSTTNGDASKYVLT